MLSTICIHQPDFAPHLGFFHRLLFAEHFIILDDAQFIKGGWQNRDRIKGKYGPTWLSLSIVKRYPQQINDVMLVSGEKWVEDNLNLLCDSYRYAPYFDEVFTRIESIYRGSHERMIDLNMDMMRLAFEYFQITIPISYSSQYQIAAKSNARLIALIKKLGGEVYLTGTGSRNYLDEALFDEAGIKVRWQKFKHPLYSQLHGDFEPMLSCFDIMFNCGRDSAEILRTALNE